MKICLQGDFLKNNLYSKEAFILNNLEMKQNIKTIKLGGKTDNCYLIKTKIGFILIVTGKKTRPYELEKELTLQVCTRDNLNLIIFTHHKSYNSNTCQYLRKRYKAKIALHVLDEALIDDHHHKNRGHSLKNIIRKKISFTMKSNIFKPDFIIDEGYNLSIYGLNARVLYLPSYPNTIGILTEDGELFCDDLIPEDDTQQFTLKNDLNYFKKLERFLVDVIYTSRGGPYLINS